MKRENAISMQYKGLTFRANKSGTYSVSSTMSGKKWTDICDTFGEATLWLYNMAPNNDIGNEFVRRICYRFESDVDGNYLPRNCSGCSLE